MPLIHRPALVDGPVEAPGVFHPTRSTNKNAGPFCGPAFFLEEDAYSTALTMSSITFFASPNTIMVLSM